MEKPNLTIRTVNECKDPGMLGYLIGTTERQIDGTHQTENFQIHPDHQQVFDRVRDAKKALHMTATIKVKGENVTHLITVDASVVALFDNHHLYQHVLTIANEIGHSHNIHVCHPDLD